MSAKQRGVRNRSSALTAAQIIAALGVGALLPSPDGLTVVVNPGHPLAADDSERGTPFLTIQGAENAKPPNPTSAVDAAPYNILIMPFDYGGPDLTLDVDRQTNLIGLGSFGIGTFDAGSRAPSGARRSVIVSATGATDGVRPGLSIYSLPIIGDAMTTHQSYMTKPRISGPIDFSAAAGAGSIEFSFSGEIFGTDSSSTGLALIGGAAILQSYIKYSRIRGTTVGANWNFQVAESTRFTGLVDVSGYSRIVRSRLDSGMNAAAAPAGIEPSGFMLSRFRGNFGGPARFRADGYTMRSFDAGNATLSGGAFFEPLDEAPPLIFGAGSRGLAPATEFGFPGSGGGAPMLPTVTEYTVPRDGILWNLQIRHAPSADPAIITYGITVNGGIALQADVAANVATGGSPVGQFVIVNAGDRIGFSSATVLVLAASPTAIQAACLLL